MTYKSINPFDGTLLQVFQTLKYDEIENALSQAASAFSFWSATSIEKRCEGMRKVGEVLRNRKEELACLITLEMGKLIRESRGEIEKCAWVCDFYAEKGVEFLSDEVMWSNENKSFVAYQPIGTVLAVMPWNFPFWQVFRFAAPALTAGNTGLLKHASNVPQCALAIESVFNDAGFPSGVFKTLLIPSSKVSDIIADHRVHAVTLTGSERAGRKVASCAGENIKKTVLELGGSDAFVVLEDAKIQHAVEMAVTSRFLNAGQSCIAAKRFIVVDMIAETFLELFKEKVQSLTPGNPLNESTTLAPMARADLRDELHQQVQTSLDQGAEAVTGCQPIEGKGAFYMPSILGHVHEGILAYKEELFGPVAIFIRAKNEDDALRIANDTPFGLGASIWTADKLRGERLARKIHSGACFVNDIVKSDPRLPFGGVKNSGYGRELSYHGIREFLNIKTICIQD